MPIDLIVVNYKTPEDLHRCLRSLDLHIDDVEATLTIIDVEHTPYDNTFIWAGGEGRAIGVPDNIGYGRACNLGASRTHGDVIVLFNADVVFTPGALKSCYEALTSEPDWAILGPRQIDLNHRIRHAGIFGTPTAALHRGWGEQDIGQYTDIRDAITVAGSAYFIRRDVWDVLTECPWYRDIAPEAEGAFLPTRHYYEETWASYHAFAHGYRVIYYGAATLIHQWHRASPIGGWADQAMSASRAYFRRACDHHGIEHD